ncbi:MAG TPA: PqqD family protein, partial [Terriglobales bacterium]|nr:PqqD family protein [Terriglobales bacterium]
SSDSVSREIAGDTIVVPICRGVGDMDSVFTFNSLGTDLWKLLDQSRTEEELAVWVAEHFDVSFERARNDVRSFLDDLRTTGLISSN